MNKKLFVILLLSVFLFSFASATKINYESNDLGVKDMKVKISDTILFGLIKTGEQGSVELKSHKTPDEILRVGAGERVTMFYDFDFGDLYPNGIGEVKFIDQRTKQKVQRDYSFVYWGTETRQRDICIEEKEITNFTKENSTTYSQCMKYGKEDYIFEGWLPYNSKDIPKGNIRIGLKTYVEVNDYIDGIWTIQGKEITKHAEWLGLNTISLTSDSGWTVDTNNGGRCDGQRLVANQDFWLVNITKSASSTATKVHVRFANNTNITTGDYVGNVASFEEGVYFTSGQMYVIMNNNNGGQYDQTYKSFTFPQTNTTYFSVMGRSYTSDNTCTTLNNQTGTIAEHINFIIAEQRIGVSNLEVTLNSPEDEYSQTTIDAINFNVTVTDDLGVENVTLYIDGVANETNSSGYNGTYIFTKTFSDGNYNWSILAFDNEDNSVQSATRTFSIDTISPDISLSSPSLTTSYLMEGDTLYLTGFANDTNLDTVWYEYNGTNTTFSATTEVEFNESIIQASSDKTSITVWANDTLGNTNSESISWDYKIFENSRTFNTTSFDTKYETNSINLSANASLTNVYLNYSETIYEATKSGDIWSYSRNIPTSEVGNNLFNWIGTYAGENISLNYDYQNITNLQFVLCNATYSDDFLNITFKDEADLTYINATIPTSTFTYWLGTGTVNKTLTFSNTSLNYNYLFCSNAGQELNVLPYAQFKQGTDYPQRIWQPITQQYNQTVVEKILYLLSSVDGIYITYQVLDGTGGQLSGVDVQATRTIEGDTVIVGTGQTDAAGAITFWMNPDFVHTITFEKSGYEDYALSHFPTQSTYTVTLGTSSSGAIIDYLQGMIYTITPNRGNYLDANTNYFFNYTLNSSYYDVTSFGFTLYGDNTVIGGNTSTTINSTTYNLINVSNYSKIYMDYYWIINGTTISSENLVWIVFDENDGTDWSIKNLFTDVSNYADDGLFGLDQDALNLIIFIVIFLSVGIVSYKFSISSPAAISGMVFALVFLFDFALGLINLGVGINHFTTIFVGLITIGFLVSEVTR